MRGRQCLARSTTVSNNSALARPVATSCSTRTTFRTSRWASQYPDRSLLAAGSKLSALPGGNVATTIHRGPYHGLSKAHEAVHDWCRASGLKVAGPRWEVYGHIRDDVEPETTVSWLVE